MSRHHYVVSRQLDADLDVPFYAIVMLAMRRADTANYEKLKECWPHVEADLRDRYDAPGGILPTDDGWNTP